MTIISAAFIAISTISLYGQNNPSVVLESAPAINTIASFGLQEGLPNNCLKNVVTDHQGRLWVSPCASTWLDNKYTFFQYDGKKAFNHEVLPEWITAPTDTALNWFVRGETADGFLYGTDYDFSTVFCWHPDQRIQYFFRLGQGEILANLAPEPGGSVLALILKENTYQVYRLQANENQKVGEITLDFPEKKPLTYGLQYFKPHSFAVSNQSAWFFHERKGLVSVNLLDGKMQFHPWSSLYAGPLNLRTDDYRDGSLQWQMLPNSRDGLFLYLGAGNDFFILNETSLALKPHPLINQLSFAQTNVEINRLISFFQDQKNNILINVGYEYPFANEKKEVPYYAYLLDSEGGLQDYTSILREIRSYAEYKIIQSWEGVLFSPDFQRQLGWASSGGLILADLQLDFEIDAFPINKGTRAILPLDDQKLLINTDGPMVELNLSDGSYQFYTSSTKNIRTFSPLITSGENEFWASGEAAGILQYDLTNKQIKRYPLDFFFEQFTFLEDQKIALFDYQGQLFFYNTVDSTSTDFQIEGQSLSIEGSVNDLLYQSSDLLWVAAKNGLWRWNVKTGEAELLLHEHIICINQGENGRLWLGTVQDGLYIFTPSTGEIDQIATINGLSNNTVASILSDEYGNRWIATFNGITVISPERRVLFEIHQENGLTHDEFNRNSAKKLPDGRLVFGGVEGVNILNPREILQRYTEEAAPKIYLTQLAYYDTESEQEQTANGPFEDQTIRIPAINRYLSLDFALSDYVNLLQHRYSYRVVPNKARNGSKQETPWTNLGPVSELTLNNLPAGDWLVQIQGINHRGNQVETPLEVTIQVQEYFFRTWWFYALCGVPVLLFIWAWIRRVLTERRRLQVEVERRTRQIQKDKAIIEQQAAELLQLDEAKSRFFANISHELRTPLTIILGMVDQIEKQPASWLAPGAKMIRNNGSNLLDLINQILDLQKLESGTLQVHLQLSPIIPFLRTIFEQFQALAISKDVKMVFNVRVEETLRMDYDPEKLLRIVSNLLSNAIKYTGEKGQVAFTISSTTKLAVVPGPCLLLTIQDTGQGIPEEELPYIFDRFFRATTHEKVSSSGTGIGLSLTNELVKLFNGKIEVASTLGQGTSFVVFLPITQQATPTQNIDLVAIPSTVFGSQSPPQSNHLHADDLPIALIIEDHPDIAQYLQICLEAHYQLLFASDGQIGVDRALEHIPDIIISDVMMPKKDGFELCEILKTDQRTSHIPIILLTAKSDVASRIIGLKQGADDYLSKPFHEEELLVRTQNLLAIRRRLQERYKDLFENPPVPSEDALASQEDAFILQLKAFFKPRMDDPQFDLDVLSQQLYLSRSQLGRKVKALTGQSPAVYLRSLRLQKARQLLLNSTLSIKEVTYEVGFSTPAYFSSAYSDAYGESPSKTRGTD